MRKLHLLLLCVLTGLCMGCPKSSSSKSFYVVWRDPASGATNISVTTGIRVQFSREVDVGTLGGNFTVRKWGGSQISGTIGYDSYNYTAVFLPTVNLDNNTSYEVTVNSNIRSYSGRYLDGTYVWVFSTTSVFLWQNQTSHTVQPLQSVFFANSTQGWTCGASGTILHTADGGVSWSSQTVPVPATYRAIFFRDANNGWAAGDSGIVLKSTNGGVDWQQFTVPINVDLYGVHFSDLNNGWVCGFNGNIFRTSNGGTSWTSVNSPTMALLQGVYVSDANTARLAGSDGMVWTTYNGGSNWHSYNAGTALNAIHFSDNSHGWVVGDSGIICRTTDGSVWNSVTSPTTVALNGVYFLDVNNGWAVGNSGTVISTSNGGASWTIQSSGISQHLRGVFFGLTNLGWAVGDNGVILKGSN